MLSGLVSSRRDQMWDLHLAFWGTRCFGCGSESSNEILRLQSIYLSSYVRFLNSEEDKVVDKFFQCNCLVAQSLVRKVIINLMVLWSTSLGLIRWCWKRFLRSQFEVRGFLMIVRSLYAILHSKICVLRVSGWDGLGFYMGDVLHGKSEH